VRFHLSFLLDLVIRADFVSSARSHYARFEEMGGSMYEPVKFLSLDTIVNMPALVHNPFRRRIAEVFCTGDRSELNWSFGDYLNFLNAFSHRSSLLSAWINADLADLKIYWAFRLFDFNHDNKICESDLAQALRLMVGPDMSDQEVQMMAAAVVREADQDESKSISRTEFKRMLHRIPDFQWYLLSSLRLSLQVIHFFFCVFFDAFGQELFHSR
jgi:Ca2+-binding EF-hand superfamily protein